jgi:hypothetical protein
MEKKKKKKKIFVDICCGNHYYEGTVFLKSLLGAFRHTSRGKGGEKE